MGGVFIKAKLTKIFLAALAFSLAITVFFYDTDRISGQNFINILKSEVSKAQPSIPISRVLGNEHEVVCVLSGYPDPITLAEFYEEVSQFRNHQDYIPKVKDHEKREDSFLLLLSGDGMIKKSALSTNHFYTKDGTHYSIKTAMQPTYCDKIENIRIYRSEGLRSTVLIIK